MNAVSVAALVLATLFAGAALYITLVEHPARLVLADGPLLAQWQPSYKRALPIQDGLAVAGGLAGLIAWYLSQDWRWLAGSLALLANWPFTLFVIMPVNKRLQALQPIQAGQRAGNCCFNGAASTTGAVSLAPRQLCASRGPSSWGSDVRCSLSACESAGQCHNPCRT